MSFSESDESSQSSSCCHNNTHEPFTQQRLTNHLNIQWNGLPKGWFFQLAMGILFFTAGLLLRNSNSIIFLIDLKGLLQALLGLLAAYQLNKALDLKLPPWLAAIETVGIMMPIISTAESAFSLQTLKNFIVIVPIVAIFAQVLSIITPRLSKKLENYHIPTWVTQLGIYIASIGLGAYIMPILFRPLAALGWFDSHSKSSMLAMVQVCPRGCSVGLGGVCITQTMETMGAVYSGIKNQQQDKQP